MKKLSFTSDILPHVIAVSAFLIVTLVFFSPVFFENKAISQHDIRQHLSSSRELRDFREATGEEGLWVSTMFSGMPAYLVNLDWDDGVVVGLKKVLTLFLSHPVCNIFAAFISFYILLLSFGVRPYLAIGGALAFGLSSYMIIGLGAGHNARIGAIAFMPLVMAGIHLAFTGKMILGFGVTAGGMALHLRENHMQITYYLVIIVAIYGLVHIVYAFRSHRLVPFFKTMALLIPAVLIAAATFFGQFWAITEYTRYSIRGPSELQTGTEATDGLDRGYAFGYGISAIEPLTLLVPDFFGGNGSRAFVQDDQSATYKALVSSGDNRIANQLAQYSTAYWGGHTPTPYYAGSIIVFLFVLGMLFADKRMVWWLAIVGALSVMISVGESFSSFNFFLFDYLPGYNKFRSTTFALIMILFAMPLLGFVGLEKLLQNGLDRSSKRKVLVAAAATGGLCLLLVVAGGMMNLISSDEAELPAWFLNALESDRLGVLRGDAFRSFAFISAIFILIYLNVHKRVSAAGFYAFLAIMIAVDLGVVDKRYFTADNYQRRRSASVETTEADQEVMKDKGYYRVFDLQEPFGTDGTSSFHHFSIGGYHGAKMRRYQDLYDSCLGPQLRQLMTDGQSGNFDFAKYTTFNMLNTKYFMFGPAKNNFILNPMASGEAWLVRDIIRVNSPAEELAAVKKMNIKTSAVVDVSKFDVTSPASFDSTATISLVDRKPYWLKYESSSTTGGLAVFSEIFYAKGWTATIDGSEVPIARANYVLRALEVPAGSHTIEFTFAPKPYVIGNKVTMASSWLLLIVVMGCLGWSFRAPKSEV